MSQNRTTTLFKGLSVQTIITIIMGILEIVFFAIMSRLLTKSDFGYFAAISGIMAICMSLSEAGLGSAVIQKKETSSEHLSTAFTLSCCIGAFFSIVLFLMSPHIASLIADETITLPLQFMSTTVFLHSLISIGNAILYRQLNFKKIGYINVTSYFTSCLIAVIMALCGYGLMSIVCMSVLYSLFTVILLFSFNIKIPKWGIRRSEVKGIISFGGWLTIGVIFNNIGHQLDKLVLSKWLSVEALGAYNRPAGFVNTISTKINGIFDSVLFPMLSELQDNKDKVQAIFIRAVSLLNSFSVILALIFFFNAELIITIFLGADWLELVPVMQIVAVSVIFNIDGRLVDCFFRSLNYVRTGTIIRFFSVLLTLSCLYIGVQHEIKGVAWGILIANVTIIIVKMIVLCLKVKTDISLMFKCWIIAWKPSIIPSVFGIIYMFMPHTFLSNVFFALTFALIIISEFILFPNMVGKEYVKTVYPIIFKIREKVLKKKNKRL